MKSTELPSRISFYRPFAHAGTKAVISNSTGAAVNFPDGFGAAYGIPGSSGGRYVQRGEMNALGNVATNDLFYHKCGGLNTFDAAFAATIGGYPKNAVLEFIEGEFLRRVISLVDDNEYNFITNGVDGVNWMYVDTKDPTTEDVFKICEIPNMKSTNYDYPAVQILTVYKAKKDGLVYFTGSLDLSLSDSYVLTGGMVVGVYEGATAAAASSFKVGSSSGYKIVYGRGSGTVIGSQTYDPSSVELVKITKDKYYVFFAIAYACEVKNSTLNAMIEPE